jgi:hypothetical protein
VPASAKKAAGTGKKSAKKGDKATTKATPKAVAPVVVKPVIISEPPFSCTALSRSCFAHF